MTGRVRPWVYLLAAGWAATVAGAGCSLLADGVTTKRWAWAVAAVLVAAGAGAWRGLQRD